MTIMTVRVFQEPFCQDMLRLIATHLDHKNVKNLTQAFFGPKKHRVIQIIHEIYQTKHSSNEASKYWICRCVEILVANDVEECELLLEKHPVDLQGVGVYWLERLYQLALRRNSVQVMRYLFSKNVISPEGLRYATQESVLKGRLPMLRLLLKDDKKLPYVSILQIAAERGLYEVAALLLDHIVLQPTTLGFALMLATGKGHLSLVKLLLTKEICVEAFECALHRALQCQYDKIARLLVDKIILSPVVHRNVVARALDEEHLEVASLLLGKKALSAEILEWIAEWAYQNSRMETVGLLLNTCHNCEAVAQIAAQKNHLELLSFWLENCSIDCMALEELIYTQLEESHFKAVCILTKKGITSAGVREDVKYVARCRDHQEVLRILG